MSSERAAKLRAMAEEILGGAPEGYEGVLTQGERGVRLATAVLRALAALERKEEPGLPPQQERDPETVAATAAVFRARSVPLWTAEAYSARLREIAADLPPYWREGVTVAVDRLLREHLGGE